MFFGDDVITVEKVVVIGIGNILMKDDGIGPKLVKQIKRSAGRMGIQCIYSAVSDLAILGF